MNWLFGNSKSNDNKTRSQFASYNQLSFMRIPQTELNFVNSQGAFDCYHVRPLIPRTGTYFKPGSQLRKDYAILNRGFHRERDPKKIRAQVQDYHRKLGDDEEWRKAFLYLFEGIESLDVVEDFWKYSCFFFDGIANKTKEEYETDLKTKSMTHEDLESKYFGCSNKFRNNSLLRYLLYFLVFSVYFVLFILLIVYNQDMTLCKNSKTNMLYEKSKDGSSFEMKPRCENLDFNKCKIVLGNTNIDPYEYSFIRIIFFCLAIFPHLFLTIVNSCYTSSLLYKLNPNHSALKSLVKLPHDAANPDQLDYESVDQNNRFEPAQCKLAFTIMFFIFYFFGGSFSIFLDASMVHALTINTGCASANTWSIYVPNQQAIAVPTALLVINCITIIWGFLFLVSRVKRSNMSNERRFKVEKPSSDDVNKAKENSQKILGDYKDHITLEEYKKKTQALNEKHAAAIDKIRQEHGRVWYV